jgi:hypothetical protein
MNETQLVMGMQNNSFVRSFVQTAGMTLTAIAVPIQGFAQTVPSPRPEFDAATIKPSRNEGNSGVRATTGRFMLEGVPLRVIVSVAYKTRPSQIIRDSNAHGLGNHSALRYESVLLRRLWCRPNRCNAQANVVTRIGPSIMNIGCTQRGLSLSMLLPTRYTSNAWRTARIPAVTQKTSLRHELR